MEPRTPHPRRPQALRRCLRAGLCAFGLLGGDPRRGLDLLGHFSEDHGKTSRSSHTSKEVDARWNTRATKHIGEEYLGNTREEKRAGEREREEQEYLDRLAVQSLRANCSSTYLDDHTAWSQRNPNQQRGLGRIKPFGAVDDFGGARKVCSQVSLVRMRTSYLPPSSILTVCVLVKARAG